MQLGGYNAYVKSGKLEERLKTCRLASAEEVAKGKKSLIGTNIYADLSAIALKESNGIKVEGRLAEPFEKIRAHFAGTTTENSVINIWRIKRHLNRVPILLVDF